jgi:hypothetical protein
MDVFVFLKLYIIGKGGLATFCKEGKSFIKSIKHPGQKECVSEHQAWATNLVKQIVSY